MHTTARICIAPANLADFVAEIMPLFGVLYGPAAAAFYLKTAVSGISKSIASPEVYAYACMDGDHAAGMLFVRDEGERTVINLLHVLLPYRGLGFEEELLDFLLRDLGGGPGAIFTEFILYYPMALDGAFKSRGFAKVERQIMHRRPWKSEPDIPDGFVLRVADAHAVPDLAEVLVEAYADHRERFLFPEVQSRENAQAYLSRAQSGAFGVYLPEFCIGAWRDGRCAGCIIGSQVLPGLGFTLHLSVRPDARGRGLGRALLAALATAFAVEDLDYIALGVTCDNPAVFLYQRAGFDCVAQLPVYHRT